MMIHAPEARICVFMKMNTSHHDVGKRHTIDASVSAIDDSARRILTTTNMSAEVLPPENVKQRLHKWLDEVVDQFVAEVATEAGKISEEMKTLHGNLTGEKPS